MCVVIDRFPENEVFWKNEGKLIAWRNLVVSVPNLLLGFAIWVCASLCDCISPRAAKGKSAIPNPFLLPPGGQPPRRPDSCEARYDIEGPHPNGLKY